MISGSPKFSGLAIGEISINLLQTLTIAAKAAFVDPKTGATHGWTEQKTQWSRETIAKLYELTALMENDMAIVHFSDGMPSTVSSVIAPAAKPGLGGGLGEHLGTDKGDAPSI